VPADLSGARVLDVGCNAGYDAFMFHARGAEYVLGCEPFDFIEQAHFLQRVYKTDVDFRRLGWQDLDPAVHGRFDLVHCHGVLYHDMHPMALLQRLREMLTDDGTLYFGSMMLADPELSEHARFVPGAYYGDPTWWWVPGRLAMRWMLDTAGLEVRRQLPVHDGPPGEFATINGYFECGRGPEAATSTHVGPTGAPPDTGS
jgi:tRNA (mo5U34)-methyltransferase